MERISTILVALILAGCNHTIPLIPEFPKVPEVLMRDEYSLKTINQYRSEKSTEVAEPRATHKTP